MGRQTRKWSSKMPIFVSFARHIFRIFIPKAEIIIFYCVKLLHKHDKLTQCCRAFTLALARLSCCTFLLNTHFNLELDYIVRKPMKHRFQLYIVRTEIFSTFHARVEYISWRTILDSAHSNEYAHTDTDRQK